MACPSNACGGDGARGAALAGAARALEGRSFRLHGRDGATGVDCIGLLVVAFRAIGLTAEFPTGYAFRTKSAEGAGAVARQLGCVVAEGKRRAGDVSLFAVGPSQFHFAVALGDGGPDGRIVHAHAGLRRVVCSAIPQDWREVMRWRLPD